MTTPFSDPVEIAERAAWRKYADYVLHRARRNHMGCITTPFLGDDYSAELWRAWAAIYVPMIDGRPTHRRRASERARRQERAA